MGLTLYLGAVHARPLVGEERPLFRGEQSLLGGLEVLVGGALRPRGRHGRFRRRRRHRRGPGVLWGGLRLCNLKQQ